MDSIRLFFVGDFYAPQVEEINFSTELESVLSKCDVCYCNFEAPVESLSSPITKCGPVLSQSYIAPEFLESKGFNVISVANNHMYDYGDVGLKNTLDRFDKALLVGAGNYEEAYALKVKEVKGVRIGFLAFTHNEFGIIKKSANIGETGCAWINSSNINRLIVESRKKVDTLIIIAHAGVEDIPLPLPEWRERYKEFLSLGADAVIAMHPHVPQGWEFVDEKPIFYSLGNFYFDMESDSKYWNSGLGILLEYVHGKICLKDVYNVEKKSHHIKLSQSKEFDAYMLELNEKLENDEKYLAEINKLSVDYWDKEYQKYICKSVNGLTFNWGIKHFVKCFYNLIFSKNINYPLLQNLFRCESHYWFIQRALDQIGKRT